jgi:C-5 cytosine-specific DNA methylase
LKDATDTLFSFAAIDIIIGGPPCVDFSKVNANREGADGEQGELMLRFGDLVQRIQHLQRRKWQHHVYFMIENTKLDNAKNVPLKDGDLERILRAFGITWSIDFDAQLCSPGRRNRTYLTNFPVHTNAQDYIIDEESVSCLEENFQHLGHWVEETLVVKANCFMAHKMRLDDTPRMDIFRIEFGDDGIATKYLARTFNVQEREKIMGFPLNYVEGAGMHDMKHFCCIYYLVSLCMFTVSK